MVDTANDEVLVCFACFRGNRTTRGKRGRAQTVLEAVLATGRGDRFGRVDLFIKIVKVALGSSS